MKLRDKLRFLKTEAPNGNLFKASNIVTGGATTLMDGVECYSCWGYGADENGTSGQYGGYPANEGSISFVFNVNLKAGRTYKCSCTCMRVGNSSSVVPNAWYVKMPFKDVNGDSQIVNRSGYMANGFFPFNNSTVYPVSGYFTITPTADVVRGCISVNVSSKGAYIEVGSIVIEEV